MSYLVQITSVEIGSATIVDADKLISQVQENGGNVGQLRITEISGTMHLYQNGVQLFEISSGTVAIINYMRSTWGVSATPSNNTVDFWFDYLERQTNKVVYGNETLIDLTQDTVSASDVRSGVAFHLPSGAATTGTASWSYANEELTVPSWAVTLE